MEIGLAIIFLLLGTAIGSFLNVVVDRLPVGGSVLSPGSHCDACERRLAPADLIPVVSYLALRGRCRYCNSPVPRRILWVELGTGLVFLGLYLYLGLVSFLAVAALYSCFFIALLVIDLERGILPNSLVYPGMVAALFLSPFFLHQQDALHNIASAVIGGLVGFGLFLVIALVSRGGMGEGDIKMAGFVGLATGFPGVLAALFIAILLGGLVAVALLVFKLRRTGQTVPFGPFLSAGAILALLFGPAIINWYLNLF